MGWKSSYLVLIPPLAIGPLAWWLLVRETGESEAWDVAAYAPVMLVISFALGLALGSAPIPWIWFWIGGLLFASQIASVVATSTDDTGVDFLPITIIFFLPIMGGIFGLAATAGVVAQRWIRRQRSG